MRIFLLAAVLASPLLVAAQQPAAQHAPEGSSWQHVQALPVGTTLHIKARGHNLSCSLKSVDADSLTCTRSKDVTLPRADILSIQVPHRARSTAIGAGIGAGIGLGVGAAISSSLSFGPTKAKGAGVGAAIFTPVGLAIGAATDFTRSTVYQAP